MLLEPLAPILPAAGAGLIGGAMNALAGGGTFVTLSALIAIGLPAKCRRRDLVHRTSAEDDDQRWCALIARAPEDKLAMPG